MNSYYDTSSRRYDSNCLSDCSCTATLRFLESFLFIECKKFLGDVDENAKQFDFVEISFHEFSINGRKLCANI